MSGFEGHIPGGGRVNLVEALSVAQHLPAEALDLAVQSPGRIAGPVLALLAGAADGIAPKPRDANLVFWGVPVLATVRDQRLCAPLLRLLQQPVETWEPWLGDAVPVLVPPLVIGSFDDDVPAFLAALGNRDADEAVRWGLFGALAYLTVAGRVPREAARDFLVRFDDERLARAGDLAWTGWQEAIALAGFAELAPRVAAARAQARFLEDEDDASAGGFDALLADAVARPDDLDRFDELGFGPIEDVVAALDEALASDEEMEPPAPVQNPLRGVGRNDPCPCGSGKKYKKCCLAAADA